MKNDEKKLYDIIDDYVKKGAIIAFSGGVDSSLVLKIASLFGKNTDKKPLAVTFVTQLHPSYEIDDCKRACEEIGVDLLLIELDEFSDQRIMENTKDRCYFCKKALFSGLLQLKEARGYEYVLDGTNFSDFSLYRPGKRALRELDIKSPLAEANFTKDMVRALSKKLGLSVASKPSKPCLATRFPYGKKIDRSMIELAEKAEDILGSYLDKNYRIRFYDALVRIEAEVDEFDKILKNREEIASRLRDLGFIYITLDLIGFRSGSMDEIL